MIRPIEHSYYVLMCDLGGRLGLEANVHPEDTHRDIVDLIQRGDHKGEVVFIHHIADGVVSDVTDELMALAFDVEAA